jgi:hypothetical protein
MFGPIVQVGRTLAVVGPRWCRSLGSVASPSPQRASRTTAPSVRPLYWQLLGCIRISRIVPVAFEGVGGGRARGMGEELMEPDNHGGPARGFVFLSGPLCATRSNGPARRTSILVRPMKRVEIDRTADASRRDRSNTRVLHTYSILDPAGTDPFHLLRPGPCFPRAALRRYGKSRTIPRVINSWHSPCWSGRVLGECVMVVRGGGSCRNGAADNASGAPRRYRKRGQQLWFQLRREPAAPFFVGAWLRGQVGVRTTCTSEAPPPAMAHDVWMFRGVRGIGEPDPRPDIVATAFYAFPLSQFKMFQGDGSGGLGVARPPTGVELAADRC